MTQGRVETGTQVFMSNLESMVLTSQEPSASSSINQSYRNLLSQVAVKGSGNSDPDSATIGNQSSKLGHSIRDSRSSSNIVSQTQSKERNRETNMES